MWKTQKSNMFSIDFLHQKCGKLKKVKFLVQILCGLFYNDSTKFGEYKYVGINI